jgi:sulfatase maturation enzyme AslB (radical SAM superfamily)
MCPRTQEGFDRQNMGAMSWKILGRIAREVKNWRDGEVPCKWIWAHLAGESLLNRDAPEKIHELVEAGAHGDQPFSVALSTNATPLNEDMIQRLLASGLHRLILSIDGVTKETYESIRVGARFDIVMARVDATLKEAGRRHEYKMPTPQIWLQILKLPENQKEVLQFIHKYSTNQTDHVTKYQQLKNKVPGRVFAKSLERFGGQVESVVGTWGWDGAGRRRRTCTKLWQRASIFSDGDVGICCYDLSKRHAMGSLHHNSIHGVWLSEPYQDLRKRFLKGDYPKLCEDC